MSNYTSYLSNILTQTTSRYNSLRRILLSNEDDGDTEDDSHVSRVLRAYYNEKGRPFPPWLPPDPKERRTTTPQPLQSQGSYFSSRNQIQSVQQQAMSNNRSSLSDLWDAPATPSAPAQAQSLRAFGTRPRPTGPRPESGNLAPPTQARPLPSQREGSYQSVQGQGPGRDGAGMDPYAPAGNTGGSSSTAQERLKARLWGRSGSSSMLGASAPNNAYDQTNTSASYDSGNTGGSNRRYGRTG